MMSPQDHEALFAAIDRNDPRLLLTGHGRARLIAFRSERYCIEITRDALVRARTTPSQGTTDIVRGVS